MPVGIVTEAAANSYPSLSILRQCKCDTPPCLYNFLILNMARMFHFCYNFNINLINTMDLRLNMPANFLASSTLQFHASHSHLRTVGWDVDSVAIMFWFASQ